MNEQTPHLGLPLPHPANALESDVLRLRAALQALDGHVSALQTALQSDDVALDQLQELVDAIKANRGDIAALMSLKASAEALEAEVQAREQAVAAEAQARAQADQALQQTIDGLQPADIGAEPAMTPATQSEMEAGTQAALRSMSPLRVAQAIGALAGAKIIRSARTSNVQLVKADNGKLIEVTSGTFTQTFDAVATLGDGWWCYLANSGTGDITLDPNASETIDGLTTFVMYPGEVRLVQCDGSVLRSVVLNSFYKAFESSGTFTKPPGYRAFQGLLWSAGASGYRGNSSSSSGGGGGACLPFIKNSASISSSESVTIGSGGLGTAAAVGSVSAGGDSSFAGITVYGAKTYVGGNAVNNTNNGTGSTNQTFLGAATVANGLGNAAYGGGSGGGFNTAGGNSAYGGAGGGGTNGTHFAGGDSVFGGAGGSAAANTAASGTAPGGGGGACYNATGTPGDGARGELRIWGII